MHMRMMNVTMQEIAGYLIPVLGNMGGLDDRPAIDRTDLQGNYDFTIAFAPEPKPTSQDSSQPQPEQSGPTLAEAIRKQLGIKLDKQDGPVNTFVIDHLETPSEN